MAMQLRLCDVLQVENGQITHLRTYFDSVTLLRQLGLVASTPIHAPDRRAALDMYAQTVETHEPQRNKAVVQRFIQNVYNRHDPGAVLDTCSNQFIWHGGSLGEGRSLSSYQHILATLFLAFPDIQVEVLDAVAEADRVVIRFSLSGTHLGEFHGIAPTYKRVTSGGTNTYRLEGNRIAEEWWHGDVLALLQRMNATPSNLPLS
jgi:predicted ester cyclase